MTNRDPQGRFIRATPEQKVTAHVERVNALHTYPPFSPETLVKDMAWLNRQDDPTREAFKRWYVAANEPNWKDQAAAEVFADLPNDRPSFRDAYTVFSEPKHSQPIEYEDDNSRWPWVLGIGVTVFVLVTAIWVMTH